ncbi:MAG: hypothetical protein V1894_01375 [Chloroflexota bacterium]
MGLTCDACGKPSLSLLARDYQLRKEVRFEHHGNYVVHHYTFQPAGTSRVCKKCVDASLKATNKSGNTVKWTGLVIGTALAIFTFFWYFLASAMDKTTMEFLFFLSGVALLCAFLGNQFARRDTFNYTEDANLLLEAAAKKRLSKMLRWNTTLQATSEIYEVGGKSEPG